MVSDCFDGGDEPRLRPNRKFQRINIEVMLNTVTRDLRHLWPAFGKFKLEAFAARCMAGALGWIRNITFLIFAKRRTTRSLA